MGRCIFRADCSFFLPSKPYRCVGESEKVMASISGGFCWRVNEACCECRSSMEHLTCGFSVGQTWCRSAAASLSSPESLESLRCSRWRKDQSFLWRSSVVKQMPRRSSTAYRQSELSSERGDTNAVLTSASKLRLICCCQRAVFGETFLSAKTVTQQKSTLF